MQRQIQNTPKYIYFSMNSTESNQQVLYEIPNCTICLNELSQDLTNLNCGHVFHMGCISQHFQYRGTCPNCQKRSHQKEIRLVVYPLTKNTQSAMLMRQMLGNLSGQQKEQVQVLFREVQSATEKNQKLQQRLVYAQKEAKKSTSQLNEAKLSYNKSKNQLQALKIHSIELKKVIEHLHNEIKSLNTENFDIRLKLQNYKEKQSEYDKLKQLKRIMNENSQSLIDYKNELENKKTQPQERAKLFYDMLLIKNLEILKMKNKFESHPQKLREKQDQISKLKLIIERQKREVKDIHEKRSIEKKKYEDLKVKYRNLIQKYRAKCQQSLSEQENYEDSMLSRPSFPLLPGSLANNKSNGFLTLNLKEENISSNIPITQNKILKKNSSNLLDSIMEQESARDVSTNKQGQKKPIQLSLSSFVKQKSTFPPAFGSFGGIVPKKKAQDKKAVMKNIFG